MGKWEKLHCAAEALLERIVFKRWVAMVLAVAIALSCVPLGAVHVHAEEENTITVRASVPNTWTNPCIWAWDNSNTEAFDQWPGEPMKDGGDGWWYATIPAWVENIIINANGGNSQTVDLALEQRGVDVSVTVVLGADWKAEAHLEYGALPGKSPALSVQATAPKQLPLRLLRRLMPLTGTMLSIRITQYPLLHTRAVIVSWQFPRRWKACR